MIIAYFIILLIAIVFKVLHFPFTSILFLISPLFPLIDILVQAVSKKANKGNRVLVSVSVLFLSLFLLFKFLHWPGNNLFFWVSLAVSLLVIVRFIQTKSTYTLRYILFGVILLFAVFNFSLKRSDFRLTYLLEDPFNEADPVPHFYVQSLAHEYYLEGDYAKAEQLIERNIEHITELIEAGDAPDYLKPIDEQNLRISRSDLTAIQQRAWDTYTPLYREDRHLD